MIEFKKHKSQPMMVILYYGLIDRIGIEEGDEIGFKRVGKELYLYRLSETGPRFGSGLRVSKGQSVTRGLTVYGTRLSNYGNSGDFFDVDIEDPEWDPINDVELFELTVIPKCLECNEIKGKCVCENKENE